LPKLFRARSLVKHYDKK